MTKPLTTLALLALFGALGSVLCAQTYTKTTFTKGMTDVYPYDQTLWDGPNGNPGDDVTQTVTIPFSFQYYGSSYTTVSVCTNGWAAFPSSTSTTYSNTTIPNTGTPNNAIFVWWDDLNVTTNQTYEEIGVRTQGTSPNRYFTIQWYTVSRYGSTTDYISCQIVLYETTNVIELKYNVTQSGTSWSASVGIENSGGTSGDDATGSGSGNSQTPASNYRFTPAAASTPGPEIDVQRASSSISSGSTDALGNIPDGATTGVTWSIVNQGNTNTLTVSGVSVTNVLGPIQTPSITAWPASVAALSSGSLSLDITTTGTGAFSFTITINNNDSDEGTYTVNVSGTSVGILTVPYNIDFESGDGTSEGWAVSGSSNQWAWGTPSSVGPSSAHGGARCYGTVINGNYTVNSGATYLTSPDISLSGSYNPGIRFWHYMNCESSWDGGVIQISTNGGGQWTTLDELDPGFAQNAPNDDAIVGCSNNPGWTGTATGGGWQRVDIALLSLTSLTVTTSSTIRVRFWFGTDSSVTGYPGWYFDDFEVVDLPATNILVATDFTITTPYLTGSTPTCYTGESYPFTLTVDNTGAYDVSVTTATVTVVEVLSPSTQQNVGTWTYTSATPFTVPASSTGYAITGTFDCTSTSTGGPLTTLTATPYLYGTQATTGTFVETEYDRNFMVDNGPPPPPPSLEVHETTFSGALINYQDTHDFGQQDVNSGGTAWWRVVLYNTTGIDVNIGTPALSGADAADFELNTASFSTPVASGSQTYFDVRFDPTLPGVKNATLTFTHDAALPTSPFEIFLTGEGTGTPPEMELHEIDYLGPQVSNGDPAANNRDFGAVDITSGGSNWLNIVIWNRLTTTINVTVPTLGGTDPGEFAISTASYTTSIAAGAQTFFSLRFVPTSAGQKTATVSFVHDASNPPAGIFTFDITGLGISSQPSVSVRESSPTGTAVANGAAAANGRDFGDQLLVAGPTAALTVYITNPGTQTLTLGAPTLGGANPGEFVIDTTGFSTSVAAAGNTSFTLAFDPSTAGQQTATVSFTHNDPSQTSPFTFDITGNGISNNLPTISVTAGGSSVPNGGTVNADYLDTLASLNIQITVDDADGDPTDLDASITGVTTQGFLTSEFATASSQAVSYTRTPTTGTFNAVNGSSHTVTLTADDGQGGQSTFTFYLQGAPYVPMISVREQGSAQTISSGAAAGGGRDFGTQLVSAGPTATLTMQIDNTGNGDLNITSITLSGPNASDFVLTAAGLPAAAQPGSPYTFDLQFDPAQVGLKQATVVIQHNGANLSGDFTFGIQGTGSDPNGVSITTASLPSGTVGKDYGPYSLSAQLGTAPYTWSLFSGALPPGVSLSSAGVLSGMVGAPDGNYTFTVRVSDASGGTDEQQLTIYIAANPGTALGGEGTGTGQGFGGAAGSCSAGEGANYWAFAALLALFSLAALSRRLRSSRE